MGAAVVAGGAAGVVADRGGLGGRVGGWPVDPHGLPHPQPYPEPNVNVSEYFKKQCCTVTIYSCVYGSILLYLLRWALS